MLSNGVERLIKDEGTFISRCIFSPKKNELEKEISGFGPDVIILEGSIFSGEISLLQAMKDRKKWCIILLDYQDNLLHILARDEIRIFETKDLIEVIRRGFGLLGEKERIPDPS